MRWGTCVYEALSTSSVSLSADSFPSWGKPWQARSQSLPFQGRWLGEAETERSYQICGNLSVTFGDSSPGRGAFPRKKVKFIQISKAPSIDSNCSKATSCKFGTPVSGGAYQDIRKVTTEWNDACNIGTHLNSEAESTRT